jgi:hypothetical protein
MNATFDDCPPAIPIDLRALQRRAQQYLRRCEKWLATQGSGLRAQASGPRGDGTDDGLQPMTIVSRLSLIVPTEIDRALAAWFAPPDESHELIVDPEDAAAIALVAIEHSRGAWLALVKSQQIRAVAAEPFITDLVWLRHEVERTFPNRREAPR